jgi:arylsulfatase A-like enzyme
VAPYREVVKDEKLAHYYAAVTRMDKVIGDVLKTLDDASQTDNTIVLFMSDNGGSGNGGNAPLKGSKGTMWEGGLRVPFLIRWPGKVPAGKVTDEFLTALEIVPTLLAATSTQAPQDTILDGFDMLPVLRGEVPSPRTEMFWQRRNDKAARVGHWKWIDSGKGKGLYDLSTDLGENHDVSKEHPDVVQNMQARFADWKRQMDQTEPRGPFRDF